MSYQKKEPIRVWRLVLIEGEHKQDVPTKPQATTFVRVVFLPIALKMGPLMLALGIFGGLMVLRFLLKNVNWWIHERPLSGKQYSLPPGDMGLPIIGNMWSFLMAFKYGRPDSYVESFVKKLVFI